LHDATAARAARSEADMSLARFVMLPPIIVRLRIAGPPIARIVHTAVGFSRRRHRLLPSVRFDSGQQRAVPKLPLQILVTYYPSGD
jgi:hypothetical protein